MLKVFAGLGTARPIRNIVQAASGPECGVLAENANSVCGVWGTARPLRNIVQAASGSALKGLGVHLGRFETLYRLLLNQNADLLL